MDARCQVQTRETPVRRHRTSWAKGAPQNYQTGHTSHHKFHLDLLPPPHPHVRWPRTESLKACVLIRHCSGPTPMKLFDWMPSLSHPQLSLNTNIRIGCPTPHRDQAVARGHQGSAPPCRPLPIAQGPTKSYPATTNDEYLTQLQTALLNFTETEIIC